MKKTIIDKVRMMRFLFLITLTVTIAQKQHILKPLYMVPSDRQARVNWQVNVGQIMEHTQSWFRREFGRTFEYEDPQLVNMNYTEEEILNYESADTNSTSEKASAFSRYYVQHEFSEIYNAFDKLFVNFIEVDFWIARGGTGLVTLGGVEMNNYEQYEMQTVIPFHHEIAHQLGLHHTQETIDCLNAADPTLELKFTETFMNPIMVYFQPYAVEDYQRKLLLDPNYYTQCLLATDLTFFDHPSNYLKCQNSPDINMDGVVDINDIAQLLVNWGQCPNPYCRADINCDSMVNIDDLAKVLVNYKRLQISNIILSLLEYR